MVKKLYTSSDLNKLYEINLSKCKLDLTKLLNATTLKNLNHLLKLKIPNTF